MAARHGKPGMDGSQEIAGYPGTWEKWIAGVCEAFTRANIRFFDAAEIEAAKAWPAEA